MTLDAPYKNIFTRTGSRFFLLRKKYSIIFSLLIRLVAFLLLFCNCQNSQAQEYFGFNQKRKKLTFKFTLHRNLIIIPVFLNNQGPYNFVLDTGVGTAIITDPSLLTSLNLKKEREIKVTGAGSDQSDLKAFTISNVKVQVANVIAPNLSLTILSDDVFNLSAYVGMPIYGILGYQFFNSFVVRINFAESNLTLYQPDTYVYRKRDGARIPFEIDDLKPYVYGLTALNDSTNIKLRLILDTGAGHAISLEQGSHPGINVPQPALRTQLGTGLSGTIRGYLGRVQSFQLRNYKFNNVISSFPDHDDVGAKVGSKVNRNGNLGNEILKRFNVVIDYSRSALFLRPNSSYRDPFEHDMCGIEIMAMSSDLNRYIVAKVEPGSPAADAGLMVEDEILFINTAPARALTISQIDKLLHYKDGYRLIIIIRRNNELLYRFITLKRRI